MSALELEDREDREFLKDESEKLCQLVYAIKKAKEDRSKKEIEVICSYLRRIEAFKRFSTDELISLIDSLQFQKVKKGTMREFDFKHMVVLLKGQVFVMTHNRLNKESSSQIAKPIELRMDTLLDPG